uniref:CCHC-type domain-containing protein n=1 Tax=Ananas comosus var. bracteatus TaxID=296719 RepID=A0A6V7PY61_ANACO|nr:unnamed protein product [Ananas comosus var. bracteatus]
MVGRGRGRGRGNQGQQADMAEMRCMIEDLSLAVQALQRQEPVVARMENPEGDHDPVDMPEGSLEDETNQEDFENPFIMLELQVTRALHFNGGRELKSNVCDKYEKFHSLKQRSMNVEEYTSEFYNLSVRVGLNETNEQVTSRYLAGLNPSVRDEMGVVRLFSLEDARQCALLAEKRVWRYGARKPLVGRTTDATQRGFGAVRNVKSEQTSQRTSQETYENNRPTGGGASNFERNDKGKTKARYGAQNHSSTIASKGGSSSQIRCFTCGEKGHNSYACPERRVNLAELEDNEYDELEPIYDDYVEDSEEVDVVSPWWFDE